LKRILGALFCTLLFSGLNFAQSTDIAVLAGGIFTSDQNPPIGTGSCTISNSSCGATIHTPARISYEGALGHRLVNLHFVSLHLDLPVVGTPTRSVVQGGFRQDYSTVYFTPGVKLKLAVPFFSPFLTAGGGLAHYSASGSGILATGSSTVGAFQVGGGFDISLGIPFLGLRAEVRDFHTGTPNFNVGQNNIFAGAGIVLKF
jgi:hypothetical protein